MTNDVLKQLSFTFLVEGTEIPPDVARLLLNQCIWDEAGFTGYLGKDSGQYLISGDGSEMAVDLFGLRHVAQEGTMEGEDERLAKWLLEEAPEVGWVLIRQVQ